MSAEWPRALVFAFTIFYVLGGMTWVAIENNRDPNSEKLRRALIYFVALYITFLIVVGIASP
ncbi:MAG: hypothetical protein GY844_12530 [Bradyrhizobium sp.]|nr:hypothetical protein [Bradyrhizobium sp.]